MISTIAIGGYRSLRDVALPLGRLTLVTGPNGSGKSNVYRALRLLADCGQGRVIGSLAREGGLQSVLWAGPETLAGARRRGHPVEGTRRSGPISLLLGVAGDDGGYLVDLGLPVQAGSAFDRDPEIKREIVWSGPVMREATVTAARAWSRVRLRDDWGSLEPSPARLPTHRSMLTELADPTLAPELCAMREQLRGWRFYDGFRVDADAPARRPQVGTRAPVLADDGADLAAAWQTIVEFGQGGHDAAVADAFDGSRVEVSARDGLFELTLHQPGMLRTLRAGELSDGTLRYLLWVTALLTVEPPPLMVLNEPETSLHPSLIEPLARLVVGAAARSQVVVVSHSEPLLGAIEAAAQAVPAAGPAGTHSPAVDVSRIGLHKDLGETFVDDQGLLTRPEWHWGKRQRATR
ncbi:MAG: AAA family ATPase [Micrococcales bacterium]|nr:AAA family ATPase [Micrococcales bacterium]